MEVKLVQFISIILHLRVSQLFEHHMHTVYAYSQKSVILCFLVFLACFTAILDTKVRFTQYF